MKDIRLAHKAPKPSAASHSSTAILMKEVNLQQTPIHSPKAHINHFDMNQMSPLFLMARTRPFNQEAILGPHPQPLEPLFLPNHHSSRPKSRRRYNPIELLLSKLQPNPLPLNLRLSTSNQAHTCTTSPLPAFPRMSSPT